MSTINLVIEQTRIVKLDNGIASLVVNKKKLIHRGMITSLPPTPAIVQTDMSSGSTMIPPISRGSTGNTPL
jgi:hypothetical protein